MPNWHLLWFVLSGCLFLSMRQAWAQADLAVAEQPVSMGRVDSTQRDVLDYVHRIFPRIKVSNDTAGQMTVGKVFAWILPSISYEPQTRLAAYLGGNVAFRTTGANVSSVYPTIAYTQNKQIIFHTAANVWLPRNRFNLTTDWRAMHYPQLTYGLGSATETPNAVLLSYNYLRLYQTLSRKVARRIYVGGGYSLDYHWAIQAQESTGDPIPTGGYTLKALHQSTSSGLTLNFLYDGRTNLLNPGPGFFANVLFRDNQRWLGSDTDYQSMLIDVRKYVIWPCRSANILAFWSYNQLTLAGTPPYLDLPTTGWDANNNMGRGYIQSRFRGKNLLYAEMEYRFAIVPSGVLGGVVFTNVQTASEPQNNQFVRLRPAGGAGLRIKLNKVSGVNLAIDYSLGTGNSQSVYFNIGELF